MKSLPLARMHKTSAPTGAGVVLALVMCIVSSPRSAFGAGEQPLASVDHGSAESTVFPREPVGLPRASGKSVSAEKGAGDQERPPRGQAALTTGLPFFPEEHLEGELAVDIRYGYKFWWLVPYVAGGFRQGRLDPWNWPWEARDRKLRAWHVTVGARLEIPASRKIVPFIGIAAERSYWAYTDDASPYCHEPWYPSTWRCYRRMDWTAGYGVKPQIGLIYKPERSLGLEFWVEYVHVVNPDMFNRNIHFLSPSVGLAWHH